VTLSVVPSLVSEIVCSVSSLASTTSSSGGPRAVLLTSVPVGSALDGAGADAALSTGASADESAAPPEGVSDEPDALLLTEICASSGVGDDTAEPSWLPLASLLTLGASGVTEEVSETAAGAAAASAVVGAEGVSIVVVTGGTSPVRSGAGSCTADTDATATLDATALARLELSERRGCDDTVAFEEDAGAQPSSP
jgi:hypothetical protein